MSHSVQIKTNIQASLINKNLVLCLALFVVPLSGLSIDIYVPSLPAVSHYFGVDKSFAQLSITFYMAGLGIMQLFGGIISDSFGRKKPFLIATSAFILATFLIPFSHDIYQLLFLRLIQGSTVAVVVVPMRAVVADLFQGEEYSKKSSYMFLSWSMGPIVAPAIGGYLQYYFGWQANFYLLLIYSLISFILVALYMPETSVHRHPFNIKNSLCRYTEMLTHKEYIVGITINSLLYSLVLLFAVVGPFLIEKILHFTAVEFGRFALLTGLAWFLGGFTNRFITHVPYEKRARLAFLSMLIVSLIAVLMDFLFPINIYLIMVPTTLLVYLSGTVFPNNFARAMTLFPKNSASANALFGSIIFFVAGLSSGLGTLLKSSSEIPLAIAFVLIAIACLGISFVFLKYETETVEKKYKHLGITK